MNDHAWLRELLAAGMFTAHGDDIAALLAELDHLRARLEVTPQGPDGIDARDETIRSLEADASRYRWLRNDAGKEDGRTPFCVNGEDDADCDYIAGASLDAAIDAARGMGEAP